MENSEPDQMWVSFSAVADPHSSSLIHGVGIPHPRAYAGGFNDALDIGVILLDEAVGLKPVQLPQRGLLDRLKAQHSLRNRPFTAVGYGAVRDDKTAGWHSIEGNAERRYVHQDVKALRKAWLQLSMNPSTGDGGTCYGDSGGPHFLGGPDSNLVVAITVTGDRGCRATDTTYRIDTRPARQFLARFVELP